MRLLSLSFSLLLAASPAFAQTDDLLRDLLKTSPQLSAAKSQAEAAKADLWEARGARLPQLRLEAQASSLDETIRINGVPGELTATRDPNAMSAVVDQAIFTSGRIGGAVGAAKASADAAGHTYEAARQDVLLSGAVAIADVVRDRAVLLVRQQTEAVVARRLQESEARRRAGLATDTDVRQSEARLAQAQAERIFAEGALERSQAAFARVFGFEAPQDLTLPVAPLAMPSDLQVALDASMSANPDLASSADQTMAARRAVKAERGALLPQVSVSASASRIENERFGIDLGEAEQYAVTLNGRWDVFQGGSGHARTRAARRRASAAEDIHRFTERQIRESTISAWTNMLTARSAVRARSAQVDAATIASEGVAAEFRSGRRTRLDVLDADRERANAEAALVSARRDLSITEFSMLRVMGAL